jgi:hypothetical protein
MQSIFIRLECATVRGVNTTCLNSQSKACQRSRVMLASKVSHLVPDMSLSSCKNGQPISSISGASHMLNASSGIFGKNSRGSTITPNVELTGAARLHRAASSDRRERGRAQGYAAFRCTPRRTVSRSLSSTFPPPIAESLRMMETMRVKAVHCSGVFIVAPSLSNSANASIAEDEPYRQIRHFASAVFVARSRPSGDCLCFPIFACSDTHLK